MKLKGAKYEFDCAVHQTSDRILDKPIILRLDETGESRGKLPSNCSTLLMKYKKLDSLQTSKPPLSGSQYRGNVERNKGVINPCQFHYDITFFTQSKHIY